MYCSKCGFKNEDGALFCEECGTKLKVKTIINDNKSNEEKVTETKKEEPQIEEIQVKEEPKEENKEENKESSSETKNKKRNPLVTLIIIAIIACGAVFGYKYYNDNFNTKVSTEWGNRYYVLLKEVKEEKDEETLKYKYGMSNNVEDISIQFYQVDGLETPVMLMNYKEDGKNNCNIYYYDNDNKINYAKHSAGSTIEKLYDIKSNEEKYFVHYENEQNQENTFLSIDKAIANITNNSVGLETSTNGIINKEIQDDVIIIKDSEMDSNNPSSEFSQNFKKEEDDFVEIDLNASDKELSENINNAVDKSEIEDVSKEEPKKENTENDKVEETVNYTKKDTSKDIVYTGLKISGIDEIQRKYIYAYPVINISAPIADDINKKIYDSYGGTQETLETGRMMWDHMGTGYVCYLNDDILSLIVASTGNDCTWQTIYNIDLKNMAEVSSDTLLNRKNINKNELLTKIKDITKQEMYKTKEEQKTEYGDYVDRIWNDDYTTFEEDVDALTLDSNVFLDENNKLCVLSKYGRLGGQETCEQYLIIHVEDNYKVEKITEDTVLNWAEKNEFTSSDSKNNNTSETLDFGSSNEIVYTWSYAQPYSEYLKDTLTLRKDGTVEKRDESLGLVILKGTYVHENRQITVTFTDETQFDPEGNESSSKINETVIFEFKDGKIYENVGTNIHEFVRSK